MFDALGGKAFLNGTMEDQRCHRVDIFVYEFCKLFAKTGGPEYACGVLSLPDFLQLQISTTKDKELQSYYQACLNVTLHRQVGSRYFVSAASAAKILFIKNAAIEFLKFTGKNKAGNKLEKDDEIEYMTWMQIQKSVKIISTMKVMR